MHRDCRSINLGWWISPFLAPPLVSSFSPGTLGAGLEDCWWMPYPWIEVRGVQFTHTRTWVLHYQAQTAPLPASLSMHTHSSFIPASPQDSSILIWKKLQIFFSASTIHEFQSCFMMLPWPWDMAIMVESQHWDCTLLTKCPGILGTAVLSLEKHWVWKRRQERRSEHSWRPLERKTFLGRQMPVVAIRTGQKFTFPQPVLWSLLCKGKLRPTEEWGVQSKGTGQL